MTAAEIAAAADGHRSGDVARVVETLLSRGATQRGDEIDYRCTDHKDNKPSASFNVVKGMFCCHACGAKGGWKKLAQALGITLRPDRPERRRQKREPAQIVAAYDYRDESGELLFQTVRFEPKDFRQRRPDGTGEWIWNLDGSRRVLYRLPEIMASAGTDAVVFIVEGEKDVETLCSHGLIATCNPMGAGKWRSEYTEQLRGRRVVVVPDADDPGRKHAAAVAAALFGVAASVAVLELPGPMLKGSDISAWLSGVGTVEQLAALATAAKPLHQVSLADVRAVFRKHLVGDADLIVVVLATVAANRLPCDPVWLFVVGPPSAGKTERILAALCLPDVHLLSDLTVGGLLSGVPLKDRADGARGGLLREIGPYGQVIIKDFTSILSMPNEPRNALIAAFRELFDGEWSRTIGADGGKKLSWEGKLGVVAAVTEAIDQYHAVTGQLGERFLYYRCPPVERQEQARQSFENLGRESTMRKELRSVVTRFFSTLALDSWEITWEDDDGSRIVNLADLASWLRSGIFRSGRNFEIELVPDAEAPARIARQLAALFQGMLAIGVTRPTAWRLLRKVALDCLPKLRRLTVELLVGAEWMVTAQIAVRVNVPTNTVRRTLEDLAAHGVVERDAARAKSGEDDGDRRSDRWRLSDRARALFGAIAPTTSEQGNGKTAHEEESPLNYSECTEGEFVGAVDGDEDDAREWDA